MAPFYLAFCIGSTASHRGGGLEAPRPFDRRRGRSGRESKKGLEPLASRPKAWLKTNSVQWSVFAGAYSQGRSRPRLIDEQVEVRFNPQLSCWPWGRERSPCVGGGGITRRVSTPVPQQPIQCTPQWGAKDKGRGWKREEAYLLISGSSEDKPGI